MITVQRIFNEFSHDVIQKVDPKNPRFLEYSTWYGQVILTPIQLNIILTLSRYLKILETTNMPALSDLNQPIVAYLYLLMLSSQLF